MINLSYQRQGDETTNDQGVTCRHTLIGFSVDIPSTTEEPSIIIDTFTKSLPETPPIFHALKFEDPLLEGKLAQYASEIFALEMKLRRAISVIYLNAYQEMDPFNLLYEEQTKPFVKNVDPRHMQTASENQFFHLSFSQYRNLNQRQKLTTDALLELIKMRGQYKELQGELLRDPVENKRDADFLAGLKNDLESIELMRNCVAHNRLPTRRIADNYPGARERLEKKLEEFFSNLC